MPFQANLIDVMRLPVPSAVLKISAYHVFCLSERHRIVPPFIINHFSMYLHHLSLIWHYQAEEAVHQHQIIQKKGVVRWAKKILMI